MSQLQLRYSEGYDASISGWTGALDEAYFNNHYDQWLKNYVQPAQEYVSRMQKEWDEVNGPIFDAFCQFGYEFFAVWQAYAVHHWHGVVGFKDPLTFFVGDPVEETLVLLIHELVHCHEDYPTNQITYERVRKYIFERFPDEPLAVRYHIPTIGVQWAVLRRVFPDRWQVLVALSCRHPLLQRCAEILCVYEHVINYEDPLSNLLKL